MYFFVLCDEKGICISRAPLQQFSVHLYGIDLTRISTECWKAGSRIWFV